MSVTLRDKEGFVFIDGRWDAPYQAELDALAQVVRDQRDDSENEAWDAWAVDYAFEDSQLAAIQEVAFRHAWRLAKGAPS